MRQNLKLFIEGQEIDLKDSDIYYVYELDDILNPTIVKNSFSKTITLEGTNANNNVFGEFWDLTRYQQYGSRTLSGVYYNASKKVSFVLYVNGEIYESGYVKLERVIKLGKTVKYEVNLYGGLGELFYLLSYDDSGERLKLSDLDYTENGGSDEFDFSITKEAVADAWINDTPAARTDSLWHYINFVPAYEGFPADFSADKALLNFNNSGLFSSTTVSGNTYVSNNGYSVATLPAELDTWAVFDIRSYLQRPVIRMKEVVNACVRYAATKGYTVELDESFFNDDNPYWDNAWFTLPRLSEISLQGVSSDETATDLSVSGWVTYTYNGWFNTTYQMDFTPSVPAGTSRIDFEFNFAVSATPYSQQWFDGSSPLYSSAYIGGYRNFGGFIVQIIAYDGTDFNTANIVGGSDAVLITSKVGDDYLKLSEVPYALKWSAAGYRNCFGYFVPKGDYKYEWSEKANISFEVPDNAVAYGINIQCVANGYRGEFYTSTSIDARRTSGSSVNTIEVRHNKNEVLASLDIKAYAGSETAGYSGAKLTKNLLLDTEETPADYLLSYCKLFGLYFLKQPWDKTVKIMTRDTFYQTGVTESLEERIDRGQEISINPLTFDSKWYDMSLESVGGEFAEKYENTYGRTYGLMRIDTGYDFNADIKNLFEDNIFRGAVQGLKKDKFYNSFYNFAPSGELPYYALQGLSYTLYNGTGTTEFQMDNTIPSNATALGYDKFYDAFPKPQFEDDEGKGVDGRNVLLFYEGNKTIKDSDNRDVPYYITDDLSEMANLNGGNCWIMTMSEYDIHNKKIAVKTYELPVFGRYIISPNSGYITHSFDFGEPRELFIPNAVSRPEGTIYYNYWKAFLEDMYNINSRILDCFVVLEGKPNPEWFRKFFWFDNSIWRLNEISDWQVGSSTPTKLQFVKVQDRANYTLTPVTEGSQISITLSQYRIAPSGGTITGRVHTTSGEDWYLEYPSGDITVTPEFGTGDMDLTITVPAYTGTTDKNLYVVAFENISDSSGGANLIQEGVHISATGSTTLFPYSGGTGWISITANTPWEITMDATVGGVSYPNWLVLSQSTGTGNTIVNVTAPPQTEEQFRQEYIYIRYSGNTYAVLTMAQQANELYFDIVPKDEIEISGLEQELNISIDTNVSAWTVTWSDDEMITGSTLSSGTTYGTSITGHTVQVAANPYEQNRMAMVLYKSGTVARASLWITQKPYPTAITCTPATIVFPAEGGTLYLTITDTTRNGWTLVPTSSWMTSSVGEGSGNATPTIIAAANYTGQVRNSIIVVNDKTLGNSITIAVQQSS